MTYNSALEIVAGSPQEEFLLFDFFLWRHVLLKLAPSESNLLDGWSGSLEYALENVRLFNAPGGLM